LDHYRVPPALVESEPNPTARGRYHARNVGQARSKMRWNWSVVRAIAVAAAWRLFAECFRATNYLPSILLEECVAPPLGEWPEFQVLSDVICCVLYCMRASRQGLRMEYSDTVESGASVTGSDPTKATQHPFRLLSAFPALPVTGPMPSKLVPLSPKPVFPPPERYPSPAKSVD
jgi:hypothetical protein